MADMTRHAATRPAAMLCGSSMHVAGRAHYPVPSRCLDLGVLAGFWQGTGRVLARAHLFLLPRCGWMREAPYRSMSHVCNPSAVPIVRGPVWRPTSSLCDVLPLLAFTCLPRPSALHRRPSCMSFLLRYFTFMLVVNRLPQKNHTQPVLYVYSCIT